MERYFRSGQSAKPLWSGILDAGFFTLEKVIESESENKCAQGRCMCSPSEHTVYIHFEYRHLASTAGLLARGLCVPVVGSAMPPRPEGDLWAVERWKAWAMQLWYERLGIHLVVHNGFTTLVEEIPIARAMLELAELESDYDFSDGMDDESD